MMKLNRGERITWIEKPVFYLHDNVVVSKHRWKCFLRLWRVEKGAKHEQQHTETTSKNKKKNSSTHTNLLNQFRPLKDPSHSFAKVENDAGSDEKKKRIKNRVELSLISPFFCPSLLLHTCKQTKLKNKIRQWFPKTHLKGGGTASNTVRFLYSTKSSKLSEAHTLCCLPATRWYVSLCRGKNSKVCACVCANK